MAYGTPPRRRGRLKVGNCLIVIAALGAIASIWWTRTHAGNSGQPAPSSNPPSSSPGSANQSATSEGGPIPAMQSGDLLYLYDRSAEKWLKEVVDSFNADQRGAKVAMRWNGSREAKQDILYGRQHPILWTPADMYWIDKLNLDWQNVVHKNGDAVTDVQPILNSVLVFVMKPDRARVFEAAMQRSEYRGHTWQLLSDIGSKGWSAIGGPGDWGKLRLIQTSATKSNSGQAAISLMFAEYKKSHPDANEADPGFLKFMKSIEGRVESFADTTSKVLEAFTSGSVQADVAIAYESNALATIAQGNSDLRVVYPDPTVLVEFPVSIVQADWVTDDQKTVARSLISRIRSTDAQRKALDYGLRPVLPELRGAVDTYFASSARSNAGFRLDVNTVTRPVSTKTVDGLIYVWNRNFGTP